LSPKSAAYLTQDGSRGTDRSFKAEDASSATKTVKTIENVSGNKNLRRITGEKAKNYHISNKLDSFGKINNSSDDKQDPLDNIGKPYQVIKKSNTEIIQIDGTVDRSPSLGKNHSSRNRFQSTRRDPPTQVEVRGLQSVPNSARGAYVQEIDEHRRQSFMADSLFKQNPFLKINSTPPGAKNGNMNLNTTPVTKVTKFDLKNGIKRDRLDP
jgi:hypothetical protein